MDKICATVVYTIDIVLDVEKAPPTTRKIPDNIREKILDEADNILQTSTIKPKIIGYGPITGTRLPRIPPAPPYHYDK